MLDHIEPKHYIFPIAVFINAVQISVYMLKLSQNALKIDLHSILDNLKCIFQVKQNGLKSISC
jgi:hypothetical protein